jgi:hypothetical protein
MVMRLSAILLATLVASACVPDVGPTGGETGGDTGDGDGTGGGSGGGNGSGSGSGSGGGGGLTATAFLAGIAQKICDQAFTCQASFPTDAGVTFAEVFGASAAECIAGAEAYDMPAQVEASITAGKIQYSATDAAACVNGITFPACTQFWQEGPGVPAACATAMVGTVADGQACVIDYECASVTSYCDETKKCTPYETGARTTPSFEPQIGLRRALK